MTEQCPGHPAQRASDIRRSCEDRCRHPCTARTDRAATAFPPGAETDHLPCLAPDAAGFVDTGYACRRDGDAWTITAPPPGTVGVGAYRLMEREIETLVADCDRRATLLTLPHAATGQRLAGSAPDPVRLAADLRARGVNPLICGAFRLGEAGRAA